MGDDPFEFHWEILGIEDIPVERVRANPDNPRPSFHLDDDDPYLVGMADSIRSTGQHAPAFVYELVGHYRHPDEPGRFMLLQGERRWRSCRIGGIDTLRCLIVPTPTSEAQEWGWLGNEEAFKEPWGRYFVLDYARGLAQRLGLDSMQDKEIATLTGLSMRVLGQAEKMFRLKPEIHILVAAYEEQRYRHAKTGRAGRVPRLAGVGEFTVAKAALVWDIFDLLRTHYRTAVRGWDDLELQRRLAAKITAAKGGTRDQLESLHALLVDGATDDKPGLLKEVADLLEDEHRPVAALLRNQGHARAGRIERVSRAATKLIQTVDNLTRTPSQLGSNVGTLNNARLVLNRLLVSLTRLDRAIEDRIATVEAKEAVR